MADYRYILEIMKQFQDSNSFGARPGQAVTEILCDIFGLINVITGDDLLL